MDTPEGVKHLRRSYSGYREHHTTVKNGFPVIIWYKIDAGDKALKDFPIVEDAFVTTKNGSLANFLNLSNKEIDKLLETAP